MRRHGFTLIELSIVLVIIGLIVGGVLVGQDLIKAAEIRATVSQIEKYDAAANTFRLKYNYLPGDLPNSSNFLPNTTSGNGDGVIANYFNPNFALAIPNAACGENVNFVHHLAVAGLDTFFPDPSFSANCQGATEDEMTATLPQAKIGRGNDIFISSTGSTNYYLIANIVGNAETTEDIGSIIVADAMTPNDAYRIDSKLDDGLAITGRVKSVINFTTVSSEADSASGNCNNLGAYNSALVENICSIRISAGF